MTDPEQAIDNLDNMLAQLERQARLAEELAGAARRQRVLMEDGEAQPLLSHLDHRQRLIDAMDRGQGELDRGACMLEEKLSAATAEQRRRVFALIDSIKSNLAEVLAVDSADSGRIASRLADVIGGGRAMPQSGSSQS
jgi:hypothetical protein